MESKGSEYLKSLGFVKLDIMEARGLIIEEDLDSPDATIWISWERKTAIVWNEGYDAETKLGEGLTEKEEAELSKKVI